MQAAMLSPSQSHALSAIKRQIRARFAVAGFILYGSTMRGEADEESDVDLLVLTTEPLTRPERHQITDIVFRANLEHYTSFSALVVDIDSWRTGAISVLPFHAEVLREGITV
jgi:uncharacterized protein